MVNLRKCALIGCGFVGATTAFTLTESGIFSEMVLIDANVDKAEGEAMDLSHSLPFFCPMKIYSGNYGDIADCGIIIITAGANQRPDETRIDLVHRNVEIFKKIIPEIVRVNKDAILLIVSNPVDILTYTALKLSGFDKSRVIGSGTVLDTARLKYLLGQHVGVDSRSVHAFIIGEHGDSELPVWSSANVSGVDLDNFCAICGNCDGEKMHGIFENVRDSAYEVIERKGATYYAIAAAVRRIVTAIVRDEHSVLTVSTALDGHYGESGMCLGVPAIVGADGVQKVLDIELSDEETRRFKASAAAMKEVLREISL